MQYFGARVLSVLKRLAMPSFGLSLQIENVVKSSRIQLGRAGAFFVPTQSDEVVSAWDYGMHTSQIKPFVASPVEA
jgi:hypothetical protein